MAEALLDHGMAAQQASLDRRHSSPPMPCAAAAAPPTDSPQALLVRFLGPQALP